MMMPPADVGGCDAHLACARESARRSSGVVDYKNLCGSVCTHAVPIKGLFLTSDAHENFSHYAAMLGVARQMAADGATLPRLEAFLLDINCQFSKHLRNNYPDLADGLRCFVGWLHAKAGHNLECQLEYSAVFAEGLGRCIGEYIEQLWVRALPTHACLFV